VLLSFGSGFDPSSTDSKYISEKKADTEYVESKGLMLGGYTLMQNPPGLAGSDFCKSPDGVAACDTNIADFSTEFHQTYRNNIVSF